MDQAGPLQPLAPGGEQAVDVADGLGAALHRQARRLVQRQHLLVLIEHQGAGEGDVPIGQPLAALAFGGGVGQRRHAHLGARGQARVRLGPRAVDPDLAGAGELVDLHVVQVRPAPLEPAVQTHPVLAGGDEQGPDLAPAHASPRRAAARPSIRARMESTTEPIT